MTSQKTPDPRRAQFGLVLGALGVVFGDIGTSPLYAVRECFRAGQALSVTRDNVLGILSLVFWALTALVTIKYVGFVMRANNRGEGGILALMSLAQPESARGRRNGAAILGLGMFGAGLLYGDGIITPSLTVLSAIEGLDVATPAFAPYVVIASAAVILVLFAIQKHGTGKVGAAFGPVMLLWFVVLAVLGVRGVMLRPDVLRAFDPSCAVRFVLSQGRVGFLVLGAVFLAVTGAEALYADMGHFGARPIRRAWFALVLPALVLNYFGQGALLLTTPDAVENPFYRLAPSWALYPMVGLATAAAIIASQSLISGVFSLTMQAGQLGLFPRITVRHTSAALKGQIYVPHANWGLMAACLLLVLEFRSSSRLAAAYGIAVSLTMVATTILFFSAARRLWQWPLWRAGLFAAVFLAIELTFSLANLTKIAHGGFVPLVAGAVVFTVMSTWHSGRRLLRDALARTSLSPEALFADIEQTQPLRVPGTAVFMSGNPDGVPLALLHNLKHNHVLHEQNVLLTVLIGEMAHVPASERVTVETLRLGFSRVVARFGFMDVVQVPEVLADAAEKGLQMDPSRATYFLSRETVMPGRQRAMAAWRRHLFVLLSRNAQRPTDYFGLPPNRVIELGMQVQL
jgi:KUP system potassium uptake protein